MSYDERLAGRIRDVLGTRLGLAVSEKKMFGGVAFLLGDRMFVGIVKDDLMVRVGPERNDEALARPHARPMDFSGRPMNGYVFVAPAGCRTGPQLAGWVEMGAAFAATLPQGAARKKKPGKPSRRGK